MKEDQTDLITARLEHLRFMMDSGKMPIFRHRSDMFLFALEAHNIARGLSSCYYRLQEDLDIHFFVRFPFDYWLSEIRNWIKQLGGAEYRVDDNNFFAEGRAKRLTIVVDRLFGYHLDRLPGDSKDGSIPLPDEEILEPFKVILKMKPKDLVASYRNALQEVYFYLDKLSTMPLDWSEGKNREALHLYLAEALQSEQVKKELSDYKYFCRMPDGKTVTGQFCYLRQRLLALTSHDELSGLSLSKSKQKQLIEKLGKLFCKEEINPTEDQIPADAKSMADDSLFSKFLYFIDFGARRNFPVLDDDKVFNFFIRKDVVLDKTQEHNLQSLFALMEAMKEFFVPIMTIRSKASALGDKRQERVDAVLTEVKKLNAKLTALIDYGRTIDELNTFFERLFSPDWLKDYGKAQDDLLKLFEKGRDAINLKPYIRMLRKANDSLNIFKPGKSMGKKIYACLRDEAIMADVTDGGTIQSYYSKSFNWDENWENAIPLVDTIVKEYKNKQREGEQ